MQLGADNEELRNLSYVSDNIVMAGLLFLPPPRHYSPGWALASLFLGFRNNDCFTGWG
jgi:hypothetical protein